ncbi:MAG: hypothetical protein ACR2QH_01700 [Geminicoccaceae bacterium]
MSLRPSHTVKPGFLASSDSSGQRGEPTFERVVLVALFFHGVFDEVDGGPASTLSGSCIELLLDVVRRIFQHCLRTGLKDLFLTHIRGDFQECTAFHLGPKPCIDTNGTVFAKIRSELQSFW